MNCTPLKDLSGLDYDALFKEGNKIVEEVASWTHAKNQSFHFEPKNFTVDCYTKQFNNEFWAARHSILPKELAQLYKDKFSKYLLGSFSDPETSHTAFEKDYIEEVYDYEVKYIKTESTVAAYLTKAFYKFQFPLKKRVFYEVLILYKDGDDFLIVSLPVSPQAYGDTATDFVRAVYASVEKVTNNSDGTLAWTMATASKAGGFVPNWLTNSLLASSVVKDVPSFLKWSKSKD